MKTFDRLRVYIYIYIYSLIIVLDVYLVRFERVSIWPKKRRMDRSDVVFRYVAALRSTYKRNRKIVYTVSIFLLGKCLILDVGFRGNVASFEPFSPIKHLWKREQANNYVEAKGEPSKFIIGPNSLLSVCRCELPRDKPRAERRMDGPVSKVTESYACSRSANVTRTRSEARIDTSLG